MSEKRTRKLLGEERRSWLLNYLKKSPGPIIGNDLAKKANVSRQVIVGDITLLKARNEPIIATSQGYVYISQTTESTVEKTIACYHTRDQTEEELNIIVDHGVTVKDVKIEHPVYGDLTASIMVSTRKQVQSFLAHIEKTKASLLSELTSGFHLHTLSAPNSQAIEKVEQALKEAEVLIDEN